MTGSKSGPWIAGTVIVSLLLVVASWFLAISPVMASTTAANESAVAQRDQNALLQNKIKVLKQQSLKLDEYRATLAGLQLRIPTTSALAEYQRQLAAIAALHSVTIASLTVATPTQVVAAAAAAPATEEVVDPAAATDGAAPADGAVPAAPVSTTLQGFYELGVGIDVVGTYANVQAFLSDVQTNPGRILFVSALSGLSTTENPEGGGIPATAVGDLRLTVTGSLFVLTDGLPVLPVPVDPAAAPPVLPVPPADKNPLLPIG
ncbi:hypothetical protein HP550_10420 [Cellulomonas humilata]|uniref:Type 4a pilus biogenesis protein PilO n=1 Tax=Cellulomonas humilata TaxID=144055 RepID=A0A7Y6A100_9CELL|nr:hypothetical protein [Cellulomonas humilata]NUU17660.1 hypothetical protein [Cellulomonas humilata]